jgi:hypothetical protein
VNHTPTVLSLVVLVALLAIAGAITKDAAVTTLAASALAGLFACLQVGGQGKGDQ